MNKLFFKKMIKAKQLEYEAWKELMPTILYEHVELLEKQIKDGIKEYVLEDIFSVKTEKEEEKKKIKKIKIE